jgi:hypothetical protein
LRAQKFAKFSNKTDSLRLGSAAAIESCKNRSKKPGDIICDPAAGTCGFLVAAGEYIRERHPEALRDPVLREHFHTNQIQDPVSFPPAPGFAGH